MNINFYHFGSQQYQIDNLISCDSIDFSFAPFRDDQSNFFKANITEAITFHSNTVHQVEQRQYLIKKVEEVQSGRLINKKISNIKFKDQISIKKRQKMLKKPRERNNISQILKNEIIYYLNMLCQFKILSQQQSNQVKRMKQQKSLQKFKQLLAYKGIKQKIKQFYESGLFIKKVMTSPRLSYEKKLQIIENIQIIDRMLKNSPKSS